MTNQSGSANLNPVLHYSEALLGATTNSGINNGYVDMLTMAVGAGSYLVGFVLVGVSPTASNNLFVQVTDGTTVYFGGRLVGTAIDFYTLSGQRGLVFPAPVTLHLQAASSIATPWSVRATAQVGGTDKSTILTALQYAF